MPSNFQFLMDEWPELHTSARQAEALIAADPRSACFYARRTLELAVQWLYTHDAALTLPYQDHLNALLYEPTFRDTLGPTIFPKARLIKELGNQAVHSTRPVRPADALTAVKELFHLLFWLARTYARGARPDDSLSFDPARVPRTVIASAKTVAQLQALAGEVQARDARLAELLADREALAAELQQLHAEIAAAKQQNAVYPDAHDYSESETRDYFIDLLLREAGWTLDMPRDREFEVRGMPYGTGEGYVDYVLWGDDGKPLAVVEAKRTRRDARAGQQQAKLYADCLEKQFGRRPVIFYTNGYEHWMWDDAQVSAAPGAGILYEGRTGIADPAANHAQAAGTPPSTRLSSNAIIRQRAIRRIGEAFERDHDRKALLVMATGAGKTRTVIALCDLLMRCNWVKRVLFLADRMALVKQAVNAFKKHLPDASPVNLVTEKRRRRARVRLHLPDHDGADRRDAATASGVSAPGISIWSIIDEAHRSVYQKYRAIFDYFDSPARGPDGHAEGRGGPQHLRPVRPGDRACPPTPTGWSEAVRDGFLVPAQAVSVPLKFQREGIKIRRSVARRRRSSGTRWNGTRTAPCPDAWKPRR